MKFKIKAVPSNPQHTHHWYPNIENPISLYLYQGDFGSGMYWIPCKPEELGKNETSLPFPTAVIDGLTAQRLMDQLWDLGLSPTGGFANAAIRAQLDHIESLKKEIERLVQQAKKP